MIELIVIAWLIKRYLDKRPVYIDATKHKSIEEHLT